METPGTNRLHRRLPRCRHSASAGQGKGCNRQRESTCTAAFAVASTLIDRCRHRAVSVPFPDGRHGCAVPPRLHHATLLGTRQLRHASLCLGRLHGPPGPARPPPAREPGRRRRLLPGLHLLDRVGAQHARLGLRRPALSADARAAASTSKIWRCTSSCTPTSCPSSRAWASSTPSSPCGCAGSGSASITRATTSSGLEIASPQTRARV